MKSTIKCALQRFMEMNSTFCTKFKLVTRVSFLIYDNTQVKWLFWQFGVLLFYTFADVDDKFTRGLFHDIFFLKILKICQTGFARLECFLMLNIFLKTAFGASLWAL